MKRIALALGCFLISAFLTGHTAIINVPADSLTIQSAINGASTGDTVLVAPGTYLENITVDKNILIKSSSGAGATTINGNGTGNSVSFINNVDSLCILQGFTVLNGNPYGINLTNGRPYIDSCIIGQNSLYPLFKAHPQAVGYYAQYNSFLLN